ncbi:MAG: ABC transporter substrate-binding protein [Leptolyngbya sp. SIO3F4]|nr:ABC transporter substrate-binding protein [Leptolyngbya sp. SIO3F4]
MTPKSDSNFHAPDNELGLLFSIKAFLISAGMLSLLFLVIQWLARGRPLVNDKPQPQIEQTSAQSQSPVPLSRGERILLTQSTSSLKEKGAAAISSNDFPAALSALKAARGADISDPETLIYLNNARIGDTEEVHEIAVIVPAVTNPDIANSILQGVAQAQTQINEADGIQGKPIRLVLGDDQGDVEIAQEIATELSQAKNLVGVIGHDDTSTAKAAIEIYKEQKLSLISNSTAIKTSPFVRPMLSSNITVARALSHYMMKLNYGRVALFYDSNSNDSYSFKANFETSYKGSSLEQVDLADLPQKIESKALNTNVVLLSPGNSSLKKLTEALLDSKPRLFATHELFTPGTLSQLGSIADKTILAVPDRLYQSAASPFSDRPLKLWGTMTDLHTTAAYNAAQTMIWGLKQTPNREGVNLAFDNIDNRTIRLLQVSINNDAATGYELLPIGVIRDNQLQPN